MGGLIKSRTSIPGGNTDQGYRFIAGKIDELRSTIRGQQLILVGNVPGAGNPGVIGCFARPNTFQSIARRSLCSGKRISRPGLGICSLRNMRALQDDVTYLNPYRVFCSGGYCRWIGDDGVFYSDTYRGGADRAEGVPGVCQKIESAIGRISSGPGLRTFPRGLVDFEPPEDLGRRARQERAELEMKQLHKAAIARRSSMFGLWLVSYRFTSDARSS